MSALFEPPVGTMVLRSHALELEVAPFEGGSCKRLMFRNSDGATSDVLWPAVEAQTDPFTSACFPLVPYSNRLFGGRLLMAKGNGSGDAMDIPPNRSGIVHPVHGVGWRLAWQVMHCELHQLQLGYDHVADAHWPFSHQCLQTITVTGDTVRFHLQLHNQSARPMPVGAGFHPRFAVDDDTVVFLDVPTGWTQDKDGLPNSLSAGSAVACGDFRQGLHATTIELNHCFQSGQAPAVLRWPSRNFEVSIDTSDSLRHMVVYRPSEANWICLEPVSHATGAFSLPAMHDRAYGANFLQPDDKFEAWMDITVTSIRTSGNFDLFTQRQTS